MPRPSLPSELKHLNTIDVLLTQTKEEQLWAHFQNLYKLIEPKMEEWVETVREVKKRFDDPQSNNPFSHRTRNWRRAVKPSLRYKDCYLSSIYDSEDELELSNKATNLILDLRKCNKVLKWDADEEFQSEFGSILSTLEFHHQNLNNSLKELAESENFCRNIAEAEWKREDADWIAERKLEEAHKGHCPLNYVEDTTKKLAYVKSAKDQMVYRLQKDGKEITTIREDYEIAQHTRNLEFYASGGIPNEDCKLCVKARKDEEEWKERRRIREEEEEQERLRREDERREAERLEQERLKALPITHYHCEICDYHTTSRGNYDYHTESKEHLHKEKMTQIFCKQCGIQSRTTAEFDFHCSTIKHKKAVGDIQADPQEFVCAPCEYKCGTKMLWKQHCGGKKHIAKVG